MNEMFSQGGKGSTGILTNKQAIARKFGVKQNEVVYFAVGVDLGGYKVIYDKSTQRAYSLPVLPVGTTAVSLNKHAVLVHSAGTVDLGELAATRREFVNLSDSFATGLVVNTRNELLFHNGIGYTYLGSLPVTIVAGTNPVGNADWKPQTDPNLRDVRAFGVVGDGSDEASSLQLAINSGNVFVPPGMTISHSQVNIPKGTIFTFGHGAGLTSLTANALNFVSESQFSLLSPAASGATSITLTSEVAGTGYTRALVIRTEDTSDAWYIANAQNPDVTGYQGESFLISSISGATVNLATALPWDLTTSNSVIYLIKGNATKFIGGILKNSASGSSYMYQSVGASLIEFHGTVFDYNGNGGSRHDNAYGVVYHNTTHTGRVGNGNIFFGYGSTDCTVTGTTHIGGTGGDAQIISYAGCRNIRTSHNTLKPTANNGGIYFGAKCFDCNTHADYIKGGKYGVMGAFGAQCIVVDSLAADDQISGAIFMEQCQNFTITNPSIRFVRTGAQTTAAILIKDCDYVTVDANVPVNTGANGYIVSMYSAPAYALTVRKNINITVKGTGSVYLTSPMTNFSIKDCLTSGGMTVYYANGTSTYGKVTRNSCRFLVAQSFQYCDIDSNTIAGDSDSEGIRLGGNCRWNNVYRNKVSGVTTAFFVNSAPANLYTNAFHDDNVIDYSTVTTFVSSQTGTTTPVTGVLNPAPVRNFFLPATGWQDSPTVKRTVSGWRHKGTTTGTASDWFTIPSSEA
ncbi:tail spike protein [Escherichia phage PH4]|nr:tail spike protein [Escherichia phage PC3]URX65982.1 tail spike protein [Escherichia phage PH4]